MHDAFIRLDGLARLDAWLLPGPDFVDTLLWHVGLPVHFALHHEPVHLQTSNCITTATTIVVVTGNTTLTFVCYI